MSSPYVIDISNVRKTYSGGVEALRGVSLKVPRGEIFGLLGPNGAGKSTLIKILMTIIRASSCQGVMLGQPVGHKATLAKVGYLPEHVRFPEYLTGRQVIHYSAGLAGVPTRYAKKKTEELLEFVGMKTWAKKPMKTFSKGMKQRIGLAQALVNDPDIVFLDEPTDGVDPKGRKEMRGALRELASEGRTVFVNSHLLGELEMICDSAAVMTQGEIVLQGSLSELIQSDGYTLSVEGDLSVDLQTKLEQMQVKHENGELTVENKHLAQQLIDTLRASEVNILSMYKNKQSLEDMFLDAVEGMGPGAYQGESKKENKPNKEVVNKEVVS